LKRRVDSKGDKSGKVHRITSNVGTKVFKGRKVQRAVRQ